jgi:beta-galactosidase GanA
MPWGKSSEFSSDVRAMRENVATVEKMLKAMRMVMKDTFTAEVDLKLDWEMWKKLLRMDLNDSAAIVATTIQVGSYLPLQCEPI